MFQVRWKNSDAVYTVYQVKKGIFIEFLVFDDKEQKWFYILSNNCVPV